MLEELMARDEADLDLDETPAKNSRTCLAVDFAQKT